MTEKAAASGASEKTPPPTYKQAPDSTTLKSNRAVWNVGEWLSRSCLVRPVATDTDMGVDLYCESVQKLRATQRPFLHFWVQVKSGEQIKVAPDRETATIRVTWADLGYWRRQPLPIFLFLVPPGKRGQRPSSFYVVDFTRWMLENNIMIIPGGGWAPDSLIVEELTRLHAGPPPVKETLRGKKCKATKEDLRLFLGNTVPKATAMLAIGNGVSLHVPELDETSYGRVSMSCYRAPYYVKVIDQIRRTCSGTLSDLAAIRGQLPQPAVASSSVTQDQIMGFLAEWLHLYYSALPWEEEHWEDYRAFGYLEWCRGNPAKAREWYQKAKSTIEKDRGAKESEPGWKWAIDALDKLIKRCDDMTAGGP